MTLLITQRPTRAEKTKVAYEKRYLQLRNRFGRELKRTDLAADEVVANLVLLRQDLSQRTWRNYKNSVMHYLETYHPENAAAIDELKKWTSRGLKKQSTQTSGLKIKQVPAAALAAIRFALEQRIKRDHRYAHALLSVCEATLLVGLRPNEWMFSELAAHPDDGRPIIRVRNSKHSNGRANGEYREMYVDGLTEAELAHVRNALSYCACETDEQGVKLQVALKHEFEAARGVDLSPRRGPNVTLYSFRHQFVSDAKRTFADPVLTAAVCGHSSTKTAHEHYGKRRHSRSGVRVYPTATSVAAVQSRYLEIYRDYVANRAAPQAPSPAR
jgi:hypothetical protein